MGLGEGRRVRTQGAVDLVGRDVQETEGGAFLVRQRAPVAAHRFEQVEGADDVGLDEGARAFDRAVDVALGREVQHRAHFVLGQKARHQGGIADIAVHEHMACVALQARPVLEVAGIGQLVEVDDGLVLMCKPVEDEVRPDEAGAAGYKNSHVCCFPSVITEYVLVAVRVVRGTCVYHRPRITGPYHRPSTTFAATAIW